MTSLSCAAMPRFHSPASRTPPGGSYSSQCCGPTPSPHRTPESSRIGWSRTIAPRTKHSSPGSNSLELTSLPKSARPSPGSSGHGYFVTVPTWPLATRSSCSIPTPITSFNLYAPFFYIEDVRRFLRPRDNMPAGVAQQARLTVDEIRRRAAGS